MSRIEELTLDSSFDDVAEAIVLESIARGHAPDETIAELSTGIQESGLRPRARNPAGPWDGVYQQDGSYPDRFNAAGQIRGFLDRVDRKYRRGMPGASDDPFANLFWLQQGPNWPSAEHGLRVGRRAYYDEIRKHVACTDHGHPNATELYRRFATDHPAPEPGPPAIRPNPNWRGDPTFLPELLRAWGIEVEEYPGWRNRGHGDFGEIRGVVMHHTGSFGETPRGIAEHPSLGLASQIYLGRTGKAVICGAGIAWHAGPGGGIPWLPDNDANRYTIGIEAANDGGGSAPGRRDAWSPEQYEAYTTICAAICWFLGHSADRVIMHKTWAGRAQGKWDPGGLDLAEVRPDVQRKIDAGPTGAAPTDDLEEVLAMPDVQTMIREIWDKTRAYPESPTLRGKWPSRARCRESDAGVDDTPGMGLYTDANVYDLLIAWGAVTLADPYCVSVIERGVAGLLPAKDPASLSWFRSVDAKITKAARARAHKGRDQLLEELGPGDTVIRKALEAAAAQE